MKVVAVVSGKGGVGKSALACSMAGIIARDGKKCLLFDANIGLPNCDLFCGVEPGCTIGHIVRDNRDLRDAIVPLASGAHLISGGSGWNELADLGPKEIEGLAVAALELGKDYDHVLLDCGPGFGSRVAPFLSIADAALVVTSVDPASLTDAYAMLKFVWKHNPNANSGFAVNCAPTAAQGRSAADQFKLVVGQFLSREAELWGVIRTDPHVARACAERKPYAEAYPLAPASQDTIDVANWVMGIKTVDEPETSMLERLKSAFGKKQESQEAA